MMQMTQAMDRGSLTDFGITLKKVRKNGEDYILHQHVLAAALTIPGPAFPGVA